MKQNRTYDLSLHRNSPFTDSRNFILGFATDNEKVKKYCNDCVVNKDKFKIAAIANFNGDPIVWTISSEDNLKKIK